MAQVLTESTRSGSDSTGKIVNVVLWVLQIAAAGMFLNVGFLKLSGNAQLVGLFEAIGIGQWFRYLTGGGGSCRRLSASDPAHERVGRTFTSGSDGLRGSGRRRDITRRIHGLH